MQHVLVAPQQQQRRRKKAQFTVLKEFARDILAQNLSFTARDMWQDDVAENLWPYCQSWTLAVR
jgi:hypothetical protein